MLYRFIVALAKRLVDDDDDSIDRVDMRDASCANGGGCNLVETTTEDDTHPINDYGDESLG